MRYMFQSPFEAPARPKGGQSNTGLARRSRVIEYSNLKAEPRE